MRRILTLLAAAMLVATLTPLAASAQRADTDDGARIQPWLETQLADSPPDLLMVMVHGADAAHLEDATAAIDAAGMDLRTTWDRIGVAVAVGTPDQIREVATREGVDYVEGNRPIEYRMDTSHVATRGQHVLDNVTDDDGDPLDGRGASIAIVDSGIDGIHPMFTLPDGTSKVRRNLEVVCPTSPAEPYPNSTEASACLQDNPDNNTDTTRGGGHGTHVAGIAGGVSTETTDGRTIHGAAPGATLIGIATGAVAAVVGANHGLNWVLENHENPCAGNLTQPDVTTCPPIKSTNHSYGPIGGGDFDPQSATAKLQDALVAEGIITNWAAGNDGGDGSADNVSPYAKNPTPGVMGVASYNDGDSGTRNGAASSFSSRGEDGAVDTYPDISAPGSNITSACLPNLPVCNTGTDQQEPFHGTISGTSMATPHIAGIVTQLFQADPTLTPAEIEDILEDTAYKYEAGAEYEADLAARNDDDTTSFDKGHGLVDVAAAVAEIQGVEPPPAPEGEDECQSGAPQVTDPQGDAVDFIVANPLGAPNEPALDVVEGWLTSAPAANSDEPGARDVTFHIRVDDLPEQPGGTSGQGEYFDFNFSYGGGGYYITMNRNLTDGESFLLGRFETTRSTLRDGLEGSFDPETDTIQATLPAQVFAETVDGPVISEGDVFGSFEIVSRRDLVLFVPNADTAPGECPYVVGEGAADPGQAPVVSIGDVSRPEGDAGVRDFVFDVTLSQPAESTATVEYETADGTATAGEDYDATAGSVHFAAGETSKTVTVPVFGDETAEDDETFTVELSDAEGADVARSTGAGTIRDDDGPPSVSIADSQVAEGDAGSTSMDFTVTLSHASAETVSVDYTTQDGSAVAGEDYAHTEGSVQFTPGQVQSNVGVPVHGDTEEEPNETFTVELANAQNATIADGTAEGLIEDDEQATPTGGQTISVDDAQVQEGDDGTRPLSFVLRLSHSSDERVTVDYATTPDSASPGSDYETVSGTATFEPGVTQVRVAVPVIGDTDVEGDEELGLELSNPSGAQIGDGEGVGTIVDDDEAEQQALPEIAVQDAATGEGDEGTRPLVFELGLSEPAESTATVDYVTAQDTATREQDYEPTSGTVLFPAGETAAEVVVQVLGDTEVEGHERFELRLSDPRNASLADSTATGIINDDDSDAPPSIDRACPPDSVPATAFDDVEGHTHEDAIACIAWYTITVGRGDVDGDGRDEYDPDVAVTRGQMATYLARLVIEGGGDLPSDAPDAFEDDDGSVHEANINALAALGIVEGRVAPDGSRVYEPIAPVSRSQLATFVARTQEAISGTLPDNPPDAFDDDEDDFHEANINALADLGIVVGRPDASDADGDGDVEERHYHGDEQVTRGQMAAYLIRNLNLLVDFEDAFAGGVRATIDDAQVRAGEDVTGQVRTNKRLTAMTANGCGVDDEPVDVAGDGSFSVTTGDGQDDSCQLALTATSERTSGRTSSGERVTQVVVHVYDIAITG